MIENSNRSFLGLSTGRLDLFQRQWGAKQAHYCVIKSSQFDQLLWPVHASTSRGHTASVKLLLLSTNIHDSSSNSSIYSLYAPILLYGFFYIFFSPILTLRVPKLSFSDWFQTCHWAPLADSTFHSWRPCMHITHRHTHLLPSPSILAFFFLFSQQLNRTPKASDWNGSKAFLQAERREMYSQTRAEGGG